MASTIVKAIMALNIHLLRHHVVLGGLVIVVSSSQQLSLSSSSSSSSSQQRDDRGSATSKFLLDGQNYKGKGVRWHCH
jgi:hypothetical protein